FVDARTGARRGRQSDLLMSYFERVVAPIADDREGPGRIKCALTGFAVFHDQAEGCASAEMRCQRMCLAGVHGDQGRQSRAALLFLELRQALLYLRFITGGEAEFFE